MKIKSMMSKGAILVSILFLHGLVEANGFVSGFFQKMKMPMVAVAASMLTKAYDARTTQQVAIADKTKCDVYFTGVKKVVERNNKEKKMQRLVGLSEECCDPVLLQIFSETIKQMGIKEPVELRIAVGPEMLGDDVGAVYCNSSDYGRDVLIMNDHNSGWKAKFKMRHELEHHKQDYSHYPDSYHGHSALIKETLADLEGLKVCQHAENEECWEEIMAMRSMSSGEFEEQVFQNTGYLGATKIQVLKDLSRDCPAE